MKIRNLSNGFFCNTQVKTKKRLQFFLSLITITVLTAGCDSSADRVSAGQVSAGISVPQLIRNTQTTQFNNLYAEIRINGGGIQTVFVSTRMDVPVSGVRLDVNNDISLIWFETFQSQPLELARQTGSFFADSTTLTATIDLPYDFSADDDNDGIDNITERIAGSCPLLLGCESLGFDGSYTLASTTTTDIDINGESCRNGAGSLTISGETIGGTLLTSSGDSFNVNGTVSSTGITMGDFSRDGLSLATFEGSFSEGAGGSGFWQDIYQCSGTWVAGRNT